MEYTKPTLQPITLDYPKNFACQTSYNCAKKGSFECSEFKCKDFSCPKGW